MPDSEPSAPQGPDRERGPEETQGRRTHPATALVRVWIWLVAGAAGSWQSIGTEQPSWTFALIVGVAAVVGVAFGAASWWYTRYTIDGTELRIDSGVLTKHSRRIPYERLQSVDIAQPVAARILGLAELRIEMAGGDESRSRLQFLQHDDARALRRVLLERAAEQGTDGDEATSATAAVAAPVSTPASLRPTGTLIGTVPAHRIVVGTLLSADFLAAVAAIVAVLVGEVFIEQVALTGPVLVPFGGWLVKIVSTRVVAEWGFTLSRTDRGLRIERGLLGRTSQTVPLDRVQGVAVEQPALWRRPDWNRIAVDVAGYAGSTDDGAAAPSTLLPVGPRWQVEDVVSHVLPGVDYRSVARRTAPHRSAWLAPIGWRFRGAGAGAAAFVATTGWVVHSASVVPHHKTQSVALRQGPLQRRLALASVWVHSPDGPVHAQGRNLDAADARRLAYGQLGRARTARTTRGTD